MICRPVELANLLDAVRGRDHHVVAVDDDDHVLQADDVDFRTIGIDQYIAAVDKLCIACNAISVCIAYSRLAQRLGRPFAPSDFL